MSDAVKTALERPRGRAVAEAVASPGRASGAASDALDAVREDLADLRRAMRAMAQEVAALGARFEAVERRLAPRRDDDPTDVALALAIAERTRQRIFDASELMEFARVLAADGAPDLADAITRAGIRSPRQLGKRLRRLSDGPSIAGVIVRCVGDSASGRLWMCTSTLP